MQVVGSLDGVVVAKEMYDGSSLKEVDSNKTPAHQSCEILRQSRNFGVGPGCEAQLHTFWL